MNDLYSDKLFEFTNGCGGGSGRTGNIDVVQIGETCLDKGASVKEHIQVCHEVTLIVSGKGELSADGEKVTVSAGDIQLVSKGTAHGIKASDDARLRYIHFAFDLSKDAPCELTDFYGQCKGVLIHDDGNIGFILNMLVSEYACESGLTYIMRESLACAAPVLIWRRANTVSAAQSPPVIKSPMGSTVYGIIKYIDNNINEKMTVKSIAKKFSYSDEYISRMFKQKTGKSLKKYILAAKMKYAGKLLSEKKRSVGEIAELTGYSSAQAFCKAYKKYSEKI